VGVVPAGEEEEESSLRVNLRGRKPKSKSRACPRFNLLLITIVCCLATISFAGLAIRLALTEIGRDHRPYQSRRRQAILSKKKNHPPLLVGVVGGIGPSADVRLQQLILDMDNKRCSKRITQAGAADDEADDNHLEQAGFLADECHTPYLLYSNPKIPNNNLAALGTGPPSVDALVDSARVLRRAGANAIAFCCTAAYTWRDEISKAMGGSVPVLDLLDLTAATVASNDQHATGTTKEIIGLLEVDGTLQVGRFEAAFHEHGIDVVLPNPKEQNEIMEAVSSLKAGEDPQEAVEKITQVSTQLVLRENATAIVFGCTDIAAAMGGAISDRSVFADIPVYDTLQVLADEIVRLSNM